MSCQSLWEREAPVLVSMVLVPVWPMAPVPMRFLKSGGVRRERWCEPGRLRLGGALAGAHPAALAEDVAVNALLSFAAHVTPTPDLAALIRAAYDPLLPLAATDPAHALRLAARM